MKIIKTVFIALSLIASASILHEAEGRTCWSTVRNLAFGMRIEPDSVSAYRTWDVETLFLQFVKSRNPQIGIALLEKVGWDMSWGTPVRMPGPWFSPSEKSAVRALIRLGKRLDASPQALNWMGRMQQAWLPFRYVDSRVQSQVRGVELEWRLAELFETFGQRSLVETHIIGPVPFDSTKENLSRRAQGDHHRFYVQWAFSRGLATLSFVGTVSLAIFVRGTWSSTRENHAAAELLETKVQEDHAWHEEVSNSMDKLFGPSH